MQYVSEKRYMELKYNPQDKDIIIQKWKDDIDDMMSVANDLIQCVANDIVETNSSGTPSESGESGSSNILSSHDLGKILEEELEDQSEKNAFRGRATKSKNKKRRSRKSSQNAPIAVDPEEQGPYREPMEGNFTREYSPAPDIMTGSWQWRKDLESPIIWKDMKDYEEEATLEPISTSRSPTRRSLNKNEKEINEIFWEISMGNKKEFPHRQRKISEILDNLPFEDHPDIFNDRCELLEASRKRKARKSKKPIKAYWNIFGDWKKIFNEPRSFYKSKQITKTRGRQRHARKKGSNPRAKVDSQTFANSNFSWFKFPEKQRRFAQNYVAYHNGRRMRDDSDEDQVEHQASKRLKMNNLNFDRNWSDILHESEKSLESITRNIEEKIRIAFQQGIKRDGKRQEYSREFSMWSEDTIDDMIDSREEFSELRDVIRRMRQSRQKDNRHRSMIKMFQEWRWNLDGGSEPGQDMGAPDPEDIFQDWIHLTEDHEEKVQVPSPADTKAMMAKSRVKDMKKLIPHIARALQFKEAPFPRVTNKSCKMMNAHKSTKITQNRMIKAQAKQPLPRGRN
ncbi:hypothetical protein TCAL_14218 [Tigriopus californicus]|uniref:Uncharacterized protein n=1 Tax=Tigriopus californicus TaxID=6832 RepID=A0A553NUP3_TIGCA|nr:hypothetical protein TCAL_14218 [Tigriopus californicus]